MPWESKEVIYVGIGNAVVALRRSDGVEVWRTKLKGTSFVTVLRDDDGLFAANRGELYRLDPKTGAVIWHNPMKGMGLGIASIASDRPGSTRAPAFEMLSAMKKADDEERSQGGEG